MTASAAQDLAVSRSVSVPLPPERAFALFTERMTAFWPASHSIGSAPIAEVVVEPRAGGRWFERGDDGSECSWGRVAAWEPPHRLVLIWQVGADWRYDPTLETDVEVTFTADDNGRTTVDLRHGHLERFGDAAEQVRAIFESPNGWGGILAAYAGLA